MASPPRVPADVHERRQKLRIVRQVRVHLADEIGVALRSPRESRPGTIGRGRARRCRCITDTRPGCVRGELVGERARAVRRAIVDDQHPRARMREHAADDQRQVLAFVVRRDEDERGHALVVATWSADRTVEGRACGSHARRTRRRGDPRSEARRSARTPARRGTPSRRTSAAAPRRSECATAG